MPDSILLPHWEFDIIFRLMVDKLKKHYAEKKLGSPPDTLTKITGKVSGHPITLTQLINQDVAVVKYLQQYGKKAEAFGKKKREVNDNYLYTLINTVRNKMNPFLDLPLDDFYTDVFFIFLGYNDVLTYREAMYKTAAFTGFYYCKKQSTICLFDVLFTFTPEPADRFFSSGVRLEISNFHDADPEGVLQGTLTPFKECWTSRVVNKDYFLDISFHTSDGAKKKDRLQEVKLLFGMVSGSTSKHHLFCAECVVARNDYTAVAKQDIARYLQLRRNRFEVNIQAANLLSTTGLQADGTALGKIEHLAGKSYRIISLTPSGQLIQSKFRIEDDYSSTIVIPIGKKNTRPMNCRLVLDNTSENRLIVLAYREDDGLLHTANVFEFTAYTGKKQVVINGAFCAMDAKFTEKPIGNRFVMTEDDSAFSPQAFSAADAKLLRQEDKIVDELLTALSNTTKTS